MTPALTWQSFHGHKTIDSLCMDGIEIARVQLRVGGRDWLSSICIHGDVFASRPSCILATRSLARKMAERWAMANLGRIRRQVFAKSARLRQENLWSLGAGTVTAGATSVAHA